MCQSEELLSRTAGRLWTSGGKASLLHSSLRPRPVKANSQITVATESLATMKPLETFLSHGFSFFRKWHSLCCHPLQWNLAHHPSHLWNKAFQSARAEAEKPPWGEFLRKAFSFACLSLPSSGHSLLWHRKPTILNSVKWIAFCLNTCFFSTLFLCKCQQNLDPKQSHKEQNTTSHRELKIRKLLSHNFLKIWSLTRKTVNFNGNY